MLTFALALCLLVVLRAVVLRAGLVADEVLRAAVVRLVAVLRVVLLVLDFVVLLLAALDVLFAGDLDALVEVRRVAINDALFANVWLTRCFLPVMR